MAFVQLPPFAKEVELVHSDIAVPNEPFIDASPEAVDAFLRREVECTVLDELAPYFFVFTKRRSSHIDTLHDYVSTERSVTISENPGLHLVRNYSIIYLKPVPQCLFNFAFWKTYLTPTEATEGEHTYSTDSLSTGCRSASGLLRTYGHLIQHESDFRIAKRAHLLPEHVSYTEFQHFIQPFRSLPDTVVSPRYHYGHIRLTRLNLAVRIMRPASLGKIFPWYYDRMHWHSGQYLARFAAPLLFLFACLTLILSSLQVGLAAQPNSSNWAAFAPSSLWFSIVVIVAILCMGLFVMLGIGTYIVNRICVGYRVNRAWMRKEPLRDAESGLKVV
jgi:hypothetical protein